MKNDMFKSTSELAAFVTKALPNMSDTGLAKHLRKIKNDVKSKGKGIIIWYGNSNILSVTELRVTVNLGVKNLTEPIWDTIAPSVEKVLKDAYSTYMNGRGVAAAMSILGEVKQEKQENEILVHEAIA